MEKTPNQEVGRL